MSRLTRLNHALKTAHTYRQWLEVAEEIDHLSGFRAWRESEHCDVFPLDLLRTDTHSLQNLLQQKDYPALIQAVQESLYRTSSELNNPRLYQQALSGTKYLVESYLQVIEDVLEVLSEAHIPGLTEQQKLEQFKQAERNFGRAALMLSGGGTFGIYHIGVMSALIQADLLPTVISGTSMGAIAAGMLATHSNEETLALLRHPELSNYRPLKSKPLQRMWSQKSVLDDKQLLRCIEHNVGDMTFEEAFDKTGREVSITISPARIGQKPRILNHQTSPKILIAHAAQASCSVPGLFPPCQLFQRGTKGGKQVYMPSERWYDGSFASDIPRQRISRLYNANFFIVSQANPHIVPFVSQRQKNKPSAVLSDALVASSFAQGNALLKVAKRRLTKQPWSSWLNHASLVLDQDYLGDINIHPEFPPSWYLKFMKNPSPSERDYILKMGERCTWPKLAMIHDQTRVSRKLLACIKNLEERIDNADTNRPIRSIGQR